MKGPIQLPSVLFEAAPYLPAFLVALTLSLLARTRYGLFRDELYYLACADRLDWSYVDHPPLSVALLRLATAMLGRRALAPKLLGGVASLATIVCVGRITQALGGSEIAVCLTTTLFAASPVMRVVGFLYSPNSLDPLLWSTSVLIWLSCLRHPGSVGAWALLGLVLGAAFLNRLSALWLIVALLAGTAFAGLREVPYLGIAITAGVTAVIVLPWVTWQIRHRWATAEFLRNANAHKLNRVPPLQFVLTQVVVMNPLGAPIWAGGLVVGAMRPEWRWMAVPFGVVVAILLLNGKSRENYLAPAYVFVAPIGAVAIAQSLGPSLSLWYAAALALSGLGFGFICLPILAPESLSRLLERLPAPPSTEKGPKSALQGLSDTIGWPEMAEQVASVWSSLPETERERTAILAFNYGEASALALYGPALGLPASICPHNQFWLWGPGSWDGQSALLLGAFGADVLSQFGSVCEIGQTSIPLATPEEACAPIRLGSGLNCSVEKFWDKIRRFE